MKIGIVIAVESELKSFLESKYRVEIINVDNRIVYKTIINDHEIYALKSGCGEIDASIATQYLITKYNVEIILNYGVTGALVKDLKVSDLFVVKGAINHDFDISCFNDILPHQYSDLDTVEIPLDNELIELAKKINPDLKECFVASGERFVEDKNDKINLASLNCLICDMEIAGIARTCFLNKVRCLSIKCISDTFDGDGSMFVENVKKSSDKAFNLLNEILLKLN